MTIRDEEILNASTVYHEEQFHCDGWNYDFIEGAKWADQHPRKGLWDSEKVCDFIEENIDNYLYINRDWNAPQIESNFIEDLRKAMEE